MSYKTGKHTWGVLKKNVESVNGETPFKMGQELRILNEDHPLYGQIVKYKTIQHHPRATIIHVKI